MLRFPSPFKLAEDPARHSGRWAAPCVVLLLLVTCVPRCLPARTVQGPYLTESDAYRFVRQADMILAKGVLPSRDAGRWLPQGADLNRWPTFYPYVLATTTRACRLFAPRIGLHTVAVYFPVATWALTLLVVCGFGWRLRGPSTGLIAAALLAWWPVTLQRTAAGFADMDALGLLLITAFPYCLAQALSNQRLTRTVIWSMASGLLLAATIATWAGAGLLALALAIWTTYCVLFSLLERRQITALAGILALLAVASLAWDWRYFLPPSSWSALSALSILWSLALCLGYRFLPERRTSERTPRPIRKLMTYGITAAGTVALTLVALTNPHSATEARFLYENAVAPLGNGPLMRGVGELKRMGPVDWCHDLNLLFPILLVGLAVYGHRFGRCLGLRGLEGAALFSVPFILGVLTSIHTGGGESRIGPLDGLFMAFLAIAFAISLALGRRHLRTVASSSDTRVEAWLEGFVLVWFYITFLASRGAVRYFAYWSVVAAIPMASAIAWGLQRAFGKAGACSFSVALVAVGSLAYLYGAQCDPLALLLGRPVLSGAGVLALALLACLLLCVRWMPRPSSLRPEWPCAAITASAVIIVAWAGLMGHDSTAMARSIDSHDPGFEAACGWLAKNAPGSTVLAWWDYGSLLNALGKVRTVIDENHQYGLDRIHQVAEEVFCARDPAAALRWLQRHRVRYLLVTGHEAMTLPNLADLSPRGNSSNGFLSVWVGSPLTLKGPDQRPQNYLIRLTLPFDLPSDTLPVGSPLRKITPIKVVGLSLSALPDGSHGANVASDFVSLICNTEMGDQQLTPESVQWRGEQVPPQPGGIDVTATITPWPGEPHQVAAIVASRPVSEFLAYRLFWDRERIPGFTLAFDTGPGDPRQRACIWRISEPEDSIPLNFTYPLTPFPPTRW